MMACSNVEDLWFGYFIFNVKKRGLNYIFFPFTSYFNLVLNFSMSCKFNVCHYHLDLNSWRDKGHKNK